MADKKPSGATLMWFMFKALLVTLVSEETTTETADEATPSIPEEEPHDVFSKVKLPRKLPSIIDIKKKLPSYCFDPKVSTSVYYVFKDILFIFVMYIVGEWMWDNLSHPLFYVVTPIFWLVQGTLFTAVFVIGHDCGHGSFSHHEQLNDVVGTVLHSFLMAPYYPWKVSHKNHHKNTGNIDKDEVFYPVRKKDDDGGKVLPLFGFGLGWVGYVILGYKPRQVCHLNPFHRIFQRHVLGCVMSLTGMTIMGTILYNYSQAAGLSKLFYHYIIPDFIFASYMVIITFLHHTEDEIPWYSDEYWDNVRGQLSSVDRHYGWAHSIIHSIGTHQIHHLFPKVPHYHLEEATQVFQNEFPDLVHVRNEAILPAFVRMFKKYDKQSVIPDDTDIHIYK